MLEIIKEYRIRADLTYEELAEQIGIETRALHKNLTGVADPNDRTAFKYSEFIRKNRVEIEKTLGRPITEESAWQNSGYFK